MHANARLTIPTNKTVRGPWLNAEGQNLEVSYDCEMDNGDVIRASVTFSEVAYFVFGQEACCEADDLSGSQELAILCSSDLLNTLAPRWQAAVGWQPFQANLGGFARFRHFKLYFDNVGSVQVIASGYALA